MRHEQIAAKDSYAKVDIAAVWPASARVAPVPLIDADQQVREPQMPTPAAPDVPAAVGKLIIGSYLMLLGTFVLATVGSSYSVYTSVVCLVTVAAYFTVPWIFFRQEPGAGLKPTLESFMQDGMETMTGHSTGGAALVQMMVVPVLLTFGAAAMGIAAAIYL